LHRFLLRINAAGAFALDVPAAASSVGGIVSQSALA